MAQLSSGLAEGDKGPLLLERPTEDPPQAEDTADAVEVQPPKRRSLADEMDSDQAHNYSAAVRKVEIGKQFGQKGAEVAFTGDSLVPEVVKEEAENTDPEEDQAGKPESSKKKGCAIM